MQGSCYGGGEHTRLEGLHEDWLLWEPSHCRVVSTGGYVGLSLELGPSGCHVENRLQAQGQKPRNRRQEWRRLVLGEAEGMAWSIGTEMNLEVRGSRNG